MTKVLILGANGQIARLVEDQLRLSEDVTLTLYLRHASRLAVNDQRTQVIEGDVNDYNRLTEAMSGQDIVYANLGGRFEPMVKNVIKAMHANHVKRLIYVTGLGLYHELPMAFDRWLERTIGHDVMEDTRRAANLIETSDLNYTIIRAGYMTNADEVNYQLTEKGETYKGTTVSRKSIATLITSIIKQPKLHEKSSLGITKPGTDGDSPVY